MITDEQYEAAKQVVAQYKHQEVSRAIENLRCLGCQRPIVAVEGLLPLDEKLESAAWEHGTVALVTFGYGSRMHDGHSYYIALCDTCMQQALERGIATLRDAVFPARED